MGKKPKLKGGTVGLEFQWSGDDAWYAVRLFVDRKKKRLLVKYCDFLDDDDVSFSVNEFKDNRQLEDFINKFRLASVQVQDLQCSKIVRGMTVSASFQFSTEEVKFYDAVVDSVDSRVHIFEKGEEVCTCRFVLIWLYGPNAGLNTPSKVENICLIQGGNAQTDPTLALFVRMCREKLKVASQSSEGSSLHRCCDVSMVEHNLMLHHSESHAHSTKKRKCSQQSVSTARRSKGCNTDDCERAGPDGDLGGRSDFPKDPREASSFHFILIENLEKDLTPSAIVDFVNKHVPISSQAQLFTSLSLDLGTRGVIGADSQEELQKIADFLLDPKHIILSSRGRPWVITEKKLRRGTIKPVVGILTTLSEIHPRDTNPEGRENVKIFSKGTEEYERGKQLEELYLKFADDHRSLHRLFVLEEKKILEDADEP